MSSPLGPPPTSNTGLRRSFTVPAKASNLQRSSSPSSAGPDGIETLFNSHFAKVVSFTANTGSTKPSSSVNTPESIPWRSYTERTLAAGALRIYRVTSSNVSFLNSGNLLHTIFPKSQCWCVDGQSIFVLRIRQDSFYRIELPYESTDDKDKVQEFKTVLAKVLRYEKTRCPFQRGFEVEVEIPEAPKTPVRRPSKKPPEKAKKWTFDKTWLPEDSPKTARAVESSGSGIASPYEDDDRVSVRTSSTVERTPRSPETPATIIESSPARPPSVLASVSERAKKFQAVRSVTMPSVVGLIPSPSASAIPGQAQKSKESLQAPELKRRNSPADVASIISSADTFYSMGKTISRTPTPPFLDASPMIDQNPWTTDSTSKETEPEEELQEEPRGRGQHRRQISEITITPQSSDGSEPKSSPITPTNNTHTSSAPSTPPLMTDSDDSFEPPFLDVPTPPDTIRLRKLTGASQRRAYSPMPNPQNIFRPATQAPRKQFTAALVRRTCELILGPPAHLVQLMLRIAARVSAGTFGFNTYRVPHTTERIPCSWESSGEEDEWDHEDDFGIPLGNLESAATTLRRRELSATRGVD